MVKAAAFCQQLASAPSGNSQGRCNHRRAGPAHLPKVWPRIRHRIARLFDFHCYRSRPAGAQAVPRPAGLTVFVKTNPRSRNLASRLSLAAHPSTAEEHAKLGDEARAQSANRDTSDEFLQGETEQRRSPKARNAFNIVFVTSEVSRLFKCAACPGTYSCQAPHTFNDSRTSTCQALAPTFQVASVS